MDCKNEPNVGSQQDDSTVAAAWTKLYERFFIYKASRCEEAALNQVKWNLMPMIRDMIEQDISPEDFSELHMEIRIGQRKKAGIKNNTLRTECMLANGMFKIGVKAKLVKKNPLLSYKMPPKVKPHVPTPTTSGLTALLKQVHDLHRPSKNPGARHVTREKNEMNWLRDTAIMMIGARTAARSGEIFRIVPADVHYDEGYIVIRTAKDNEPRYIPIYADVAAAIVAWQKVRPKDSPSGYLFVTDRGLKMAVNTWSKEFKRYATAAKISEITPRSLRHYSLTAMAEKNLLAAAAAAGHSSLSTTKGYLHNNFAHTRAALSSVPHIDLTAISDGRKNKRII